MLFVGLGLLLVIKRGVLMIAVLYLFGAPVGAMLL